MIIYHPHGRSLRVAPCPLRGPPACGPAKPVPRLMLVKIWGRLPDFGGKALETPKKPPYPRLCQGFRGVSGPDSGCIRPVPGFSGWGPGDQAHQHNHRKTDRNAEKSGRNRVYAPPQLHWRGDAEGGAQPDLVGEHVIRGHAQAHTMPSTAPMPLARFQKIPRLSAGKKEAAANENAADTRNRMSAGFCAAT
jgi:hypothetical protein